MNGTWCRLQNLALAAVDRAWTLPARRCPCCGWTGFRFRSFAMVEYLRRDAVCPRCGAFERHRALASFYRRFFDSFGRAARLIHFAPEPCLRPALAPVCDRYETSSLDSRSDVDLHLDLNHLALPDSSCDVLAMNHVLDCMPDDGAAIREMFRVLRPGGVVLAVVTYEPGGPTRETPMASNTRYRVYGPDDLATRFAPFQAAVADAAADIDEQARRLANIPKRVPLLVLRKPGEQVRR